MSKKSSSISKKEAKVKSASKQDELGVERLAVRLSTVFSGRICQYGKAYECVVSDVSIGGAMVRLKNPKNFQTFTSSTPAQLVFERLNEFNALNAEVTWLKPKEFMVGLKFVDVEQRRRIVIKRLMPNRWRIANQEQAKPKCADEALEQTD